MIGVSAGVRLVRLLHNTEELAGAAGFEPANGGTKSRCLTTWRRPSTGDRTPLECSDRPEKGVSQNDAPSHADRATGRAGSRSAAPSAPA